MAAVLARECPMDNLLRFKLDKEYPKPECRDSDALDLSE
jgi:hypothetical protein